MANPTPYVVSYSFGGYQANNPTTPLPAGPLDNELAGAAASIATLVAAIESVRRSDGALQNGVVTFDSFEQGLQLLIDPTNGQLVAAAVATAQAAQAAASGSATAAATSAASALTQALAAAASAATVNLSLYLAKSNNLAGLGSLTTSRANLGLGSAAVRDAGTGAGQIPFLDGNGKMPAVDGSLLTGVDVLPVGAVLWVPSTAPLAGTLELAGALVSRATFARLWAFANASGNIVADGAWAGAFEGSFTTGDLTTTFRLPDMRGEFVRGYDHGRGIDAGRVIGSNQADSLKDHTHLYNQGSAPGGGALAAGAGATFTNTPTATGSPSTGAAAETRPKNVTLLACIKF